MAAEYAATRVFPNGFMEMELKRGRELILFGDAQETRKFTLTCDGSRMESELNDDGVFTLPLPPGKDTVKIRLEKSGAVYPIFYAAVTRP